MKRPLLTFVALLIVCIGYVACNKHDVIYFTDLPTAAQNFLQQYFPDNLVVSAERHNDEPLFEVTLDNGYEVYFYSDGSWQEIDSKASILPSDLIQGVLPAKIRSYLEENYPLAEVSAIERTSVGYVVKLATTPTTELYFDPDGNIAIYWDE